MAADRKWESMCLAFILGEKKRAWLRNERRRDGKRVGSLKYRISVLPFSLIEPHCDQESPGKCPVLI